MSHTADVRALLVETGHAHHEAYLETDGVDPEWPLWYADYLVERMRPLGYLGTQAELVAALVEADRRHRTQDDVPWPQFYAEHLHSA